MKLFGKELFTREKEYEELYDFAKHGLIRESSHFESSDVAWVTVDSSYNSTMSTSTASTVKKVGVAKKKKAEKKPPTPKEVYALGSLNDQKYSLNTDKEFIDKTVASLTKKRNLLPEVKRVKKKGARGVYEELTESYGASKYGWLEVDSLIQRIENRRNYSAHKEFFDEFPYTTSALINEVLEDNKHLRSKRVEEFIPDLPDEAIDAMTRYREHTRALCGKDPVFYIIADKKDFGEIDKKRDPILLAQSPFALSWQVLGAWDEEMVYLGDL